MKFLCLYTNPISFLHPGADSELHKFTKELVDRRKD